MIIIYFLSTGLWNMDMSYDFTIMILKIVLIFMLIVLCCKLRKIDFNSIFDTMIVSIPSAFLGGRIYHVVMNIDKYKLNIIDMLNISKGGFDNIGMIIGIFIGSWLYTVYKKYSLLDFMDIIAPALVLGDMVFNILSLGFSVNILMLIILMFITKVAQKSGVVITIYLILIFIVNII